MSERKATGTKEGIAAVKQFAIETLVALAIFAIIAAGCLALNYLVEFMKKAGVDAFFVYALKALEYLIFIIDVILFCRFLWVGARKVWRSYDDRA